MHLRHAHTAKLLWRLRSVLRRQCPDVAVHTGAVMLGIDAANLHLLCPSSFSVCECSQSRRTLMFVSRFSAGSCGRRQSSALNLQTGC